MRTLLLLAAFSGKLSLCNETFRLALYPAQWALCAIIHQRGSLCARITQGLFINNMKRKYYRNEVGNIIYFEPLLDHFHR